MNMNSDIIFKWFRRKIVKICMVIFLSLTVTFSLVSFSTVIFRPDHEVFYMGHVVASTCNEYFSKSGDASWRDKCVVIYELKVGNTGVDDQDMVRVTLPDIPSMRRYEYRVINVSAKSGVMADPIIKEIKQEGETVYEFTGLKANRMVIIKFNTMGLEDAMSIKDMKVKVEAEGKVREGDPQATAFARFLSDIFSIVM